MNYFQMYHFYKELKEVLFFFFPAGIWKAEKKTDYYNRILLMNDLHWFQLWPCD